jgi:hypothetical protein
LKVRYHFAEPSSVLVKIHGGHRIQGKIKAILGFDPQIHSGFAGKCKAMAYLTTEEMNRLTRWISSSQGRKLPVPWDMSPLT